MAMLSGGRRRNLRDKIIAWSFVPTTIILGAVVLISLYAYQRVTEKLVIDRDRDLTRISADLLSTELSLYTNPLSEQFLEVFDSGMVVFDERGKILAAEPEQLEGWGADWAKRIPFRQMLDASEPVFSDVVIDGREGEKVVVVFVPIKGRGGEYIGSIAGVFKLAPTSDSAFYQNIERLGRGEHGSIYLVDGNGRVIYHSNPDHIGSDFSAHPIVQQVLGGDSGSLRTQDFDGQEIVASFAPVAGTSWGLITEESWADLTRSSRRYGQLLLFLLALGVIVPALIVTVGVRRITEPIAALIVAAQKVAQGEFGHKIEASTGDEIEELAGQFTLMAGRLQESYDQLERKVADRTRELAALNALAAVVSRSLNLEEILNDALDEALGITAMEKGQVFLLEEDTQQLVLVACRDLSDELVQYTSRLPLGASTAGLAAREGETIYRQVEDYPAGELRTLLEREGIQLVISAPLRAKEKTVGAIDLEATTLRPVAPEELSLLTAIGNQIGVAVENARLYDQAQQLAIITERNRLARDLHDSVMQALYGVTLYAEAAARQLASGRAEMAEAHLQEIRDTAQESLREMRLLIFELRPSILRREGLVAALQARLEAVEQRVGMETDLQVDGYGRMAPEVEDGLYRVAQEALNNALKHARAGRISIHLRQSDRCVALEVADDGIGFDPLGACETGGFGLRGMQERAARLGGEFVIESASGQGTTIRVEVGR